MIFSSNDNKQTSDRMGDQVSLCPQGDRVLSHLSLYHVSQPQQQSYSDIPPTYEVAVEETNGLWPRSCPCVMDLLTSLFSEGIVRHPLDQKIPPQDHVAVYRAYQSDPSPTLNTNVVAGPSVPNPGIPTMPPARVYHYVNQINGNHITSLLPPDHPEMVCLQRGSHDEETKYGFLGEFCFHPPSPGRTVRLMRVCRL